MSYSITIGEAYVERYRTDHDDALLLSVRDETRPDAPCFPNDGMTGHSNHRAPSYIGWSEFCQAAGLRDLFFDEERGLMREHPGVFPLRPEHLNAVRAARARWQTAHPGTTPGFEAPSFLRTAEPIENPDHTLARLLWLEWWFDHALRSYAIAAIANG